MRIFGAFAVAAATLFGSSLAVSAATLDLAELTIDGTTGLTLSTTSEPSYLTVDGSFAGDFSDDLFDYDVYTFGADLTVNGNSVIGGSFDATTSQIVDFVNDLTSSPELASLVGAIGDLIDDGDLVFDITSFIPSPIDNSFGGTYHAALDASFVPPEIASIFAAQNEFVLALNISTDVSPVPLPAGVPLLLTGLVSFAWVRRRKAA